MIEGEVCKRQDCFAWTYPHRYKNCCTALEEVDAGYCPFYKTKGQAVDEKQAMRRKAQYDPQYRKLLEYYGIKFRFKGE